MEKIVETDAEYHAKNILNGGEYLSSHALIQYMKNQFAFNEMRFSIRQPDDSTAFRFGRALHCILLEGVEAYTMRYTSGGPINPKTGKPFGHSTKAYDDWASEQAANGIEVLTPGEDESIRLMVAFYRSHPLSEQINFLETELIVREKYCGIACQIKIDALSNLGIVDIKTCRDISRFKSDFYEYGYDNQLSFYQSVFQQSCGYRRPCYVIAMEKSAPYTIACFAIQQKTLDAAQLENEAAIADLNKSLKSNDWVMPYPTFLDI